MGNEKSRLNILNQIKRTFIAADKADKGVVRYKLISAICMDFGVSEKKAQEYLRLLLDVQFIEEDKLGLWLKDKSYKDKEAEIKTETEKLLEKENESKIE